MCHLILALPFVALPVFWLLPTGDAVIVYAFVLLTTGAVYWLAMRAMHVPIMSGIETVLHKIGFVRAADGRRGSVWVASELWSAESRDAPLAVGDKVRVIGFEGLRLIVRKVEPETAPARSHG